jgi:hypothetical protein
VKQWLPLLAARVAGPIPLDTPVVAQDTEPTMAHDLSPDGCGCMSAAPRVALEVVGATD